MSKDKKTLPVEIVTFIGECNNKAHPRSYLIPVLQKVQTHFGYLPQECMAQVSELMQIPWARVTGVATFYHFFSFIPKGQFRITICMGTACFVRGSAKVLQRLKELLEIEEGQTTDDGRFSLESARCIGACALAPVMVVNDKVYGNVKPEDLAKILAEYGHVSVK